jgi:hypothetical protein
MRNTNAGKKYNTSVSFNRTMIAPCGMNCGSCIAYMRTKNKCPGCWSDDILKNNSCTHCIIKNCDLLAKTDSKFCIDCQKYPCRRLKQLDKRYRTRYKTSFIENLMIIKQNGINFFLDFETKRRKCSECGATLSVHRDHCLACSNSNLT